MYRFEASTARSDGLIIRRPDAYDSSLWFIRGRTPLPAPTSLRPLRLDFALRAHQLRGFAPAARASSLRDVGRLRAPRPGLCVASRRDRPASCNQLGEPSAAVKLRCSCFVLGAVLPRTENCVPKGCARTALSFFAAADDRELLSQLTGIYVLLLRFR